MNVLDRNAHHALAVAGLLAMPCHDHARFDPNRPLLASLLAGQRLGEGCLPPDLGLGERTCRQLINEYFTGLLMPAFPRATEKVPEWSDLQKLLSTTGPGSTPRSCGWPTSSPPPAPAPTTCGRTWASPAGTNSPA